MKDGVTFGQILDLIDSNRDSEEEIDLMDCNGKVQMRGMVCSEVWESIEDRTVNSMQAVDDRLQIWLD